MIRIAIVGLGQIARGQHLPVIAASRDFELAATVSSEGSGVAGVPHFSDLETMFRQGPPIDAVALCTPPQVRHALAVAALNHGVHVLLEKPPAADAADVEDLAERAARVGATLFTAWHSRFAAGIPAARTWLSGRTLRRVSVTWHEDVRAWHPGQEWIWEPGGLGVFDPGINALSILTDLLPCRLAFVSGVIKVPANRASPIAAELRFRGDSELPVEVSLDWRKTGEPCWTIEIETDGGNCVLSHGGAELTTPSVSIHDEDREYPSLYDHFASLIRRRTSDVDAYPLELVSEVMRAAKRTISEPFR